MFMQKGINFSEIKGSNFDMIERKVSLYDFKETHVSLYKRYVDGLSILIALNYNCSSTSHFASFFFCV